MDVSRDRERGRDREKLEGGVLRKGEEESVREYVCVRGREREREKKYLRVSESKRLTKQEKMRNRENEK